MNSFFNHKTIIITGASSGIGEALVRQLNNYQVNLVLCARSEDKMNQLVQNIGRSSENTLVLPVDFSAKPDFTDLVKQVLAKFKRIDLLINNAGIAQKSLVQETSEEVERRVMEVNYFAVINFTKAVLPHFIENKRGQVAVISSILGEFGLPFVAPYCASKHAVNGYFEGLRYDVEKLGVKVTVVAPGFIKTEITKKSLSGDGTVHQKDSVAQEKGMEAGQCAQGILNRISKEKRHAYVGGLEIFMPKFARLLPRLFHVLMRKMHKI